MRSTRTVVWASLWVSLLSSACEHDSGGRAVRDADAGDMPEGGAVVGGVVEGLVQSTDGTGVPNATVMVGSEKTKTDKNGVFRVEGVDEGTVQVAVDDKNLSKAQTEAQVRSKQKSTVALTTDDTVVVAMNNAEKGGVAVDKGNVRVEISENSLKKGDGSVAKGTVQVHYTVVSSPQKASAAPGGMKGNDSGKPVQLAPSGMIDVRFYQGDERLTFEGEADLRFPLGPSKYKDGDDLTIWSFDELKGRWQREGKGKVVRPSEEEPGQVHTKAKHFTWWAAAEPLEEPTCVAGRLRDGDGEPVANAQVAARGLASLLYIQEVSGQDGSFCLPAPQDAEVAIWALGASGDELLTWSWDAALESAAAECGGACTELPDATPAPLDVTPRPELDAGSDAGDQVGLDGGSELDGGVDPRPDASTDTPDGSVALDAGSGDASAPLVENCLNGIDDDENQLIDCEDPACGREAVGCAGLTFSGTNTASTDGGFEEQLQGTVELWFRVSQISSANLINLGGCGTNRIVLFEDGTVGAELNHCDTSDLPSQLFSGENVLASGRWMHVAHVWTTIEHQLYIDGALAAQRAHTGTPSFGLEIGLGGSQDGSQSSFQGDIDELRVWSTARSAEDIRGAMLQTVPVDSEGLLGYYRFDEGSGESVTSLVETGGDAGPTEGVRIYLGGATWFPAPPILTD